jgi:hypothetical protein
MDALSFAGGAAGRMGLAPSHFSEILTVNQQTFRDMLEPATSPAAPRKTIEQK